MIRIANVKLPLDYTPDTLIDAAARTLSVPRSQIADCQLTRRAVDARDKGRVHFVATLTIALTDGEEAVLARTPQAQRVTAPTPQPIKPQSRPMHRPVVVGMGPAGLFAALTLAEAGWQPLVLERGQAVDRRRADVSAFQAGGALNPESNVQFGEGGAGTFSDGKLTTGTKDPRSAQVLRAFVAGGAPEEITCLAKPHIGTDRLAQVVKNLRTRIEALGGTVCFGARLTKLLVEGGAVRGVVWTTQDGQSHQAETQHVVLAVGHSARDTYAMLAQLGIPMAAKPFSMGVRIEHLQADIDRSQYGRFAGHPALGGAEYKLAVHLSGGRDVYSFCMCPGGTVVAAASEPGGVVTNGMSVYRRDGRNANAALLVGVSPADFEGEDPLAGIALQRRWEQAAFKLGGANYRAPAQLVGDFLANRPSKGPGLIRPSYQPGVTWTSLDPCLPPFILQALRAGLPRLDGMLRGFARPDAVLTGVETRSSSPVRIIRNAQGESGIHGLYPAGEGAGYAGGIVSAAVDGMRAAEAILSTDTNEV